MYTEVVEIEGEFIVVLYHLGMNGWEPENGPDWGAKRKKRTDDREDENYLPPPNFQ
jgi:hypothetical protein